MALAGKTGGVKNPFGIKNILSNKKKKNLGEPELSTPVEMAQAVDKTSISPSNVQEKEKPMALPEKGKVETFRNAQGRASGAIMPDGRVFLGLSSDDVKELARQEEERVNIAPNVSEVGTRERELQAKAAMQQPFQAPPKLEPTTKPAGLDVLDVGKVIGGVTGGAATGAAIGSLAGPIGSAVLGVIGGIGGGVTALFYSSSGERKQQVKTSFQKYQLATKEMDNIIKDVNAGHISQQQAREWWEYEYARVLQAREELFMQQKALFGEKLSRSYDELQKIENWLQYYQRYKLEFDMALANPDPSRIVQFADTTQVTND